MLFVDATSRPLRRPPYLRIVAMKKKRTPPWKRPRPKTRSTPIALTPRQKRAAKQRAEAAGRRYPNLVDNMWAAKQPIT
jgi:hypothetical protein